jgi:hypothetical protein
VTPALQETGRTEISPRVRSLRGAFKGSTATEEDYRRYLEEKYRCVEATPFESGVILLRYETVR